MIQSGPFLLCSRHPVLCCFVEIKLLYSSTHKSRHVKKNMYSYSGCYLLGKSEVLLLWTTGKIKIFMHIVSMVLRRWEVTSSVNVYRTLIVSRPRVQKV